MEGETWFLHTEHSCSLITHNADFYIYNIYIYIERERDFYVKM